MVKVEVCVCKSMIHSFSSFFLFKESWNQFSEKSHSLFGEVADQGYVAATKNLEKNM